MHSATAAVRACGRTKGPPQTRRGLLSLRAPGGAACLLVEGAGCGVLLRRSRDEPFAFAAGFRLRLGFRRFLDFFSSFVFASHGCKCATKGGGEERQNLSFLLSFPVPICNPVPVSLSFNDVFREIPGLSSAPRFLGSFEPPADFRAGLNRRFSWLGWGSGFSAKRGWQERWETREEWLEKPARTL